MDKNITGDSNTPILMTAPGPMQQDSGMPPSPEDLEQIAIGCWFPVAFHWRKKRTNILLPSDARLDICLQLIPFWQDLPLSKFQRIVKLAYCLTRVNSAMLIPFSD